ncbi:MAG: DEAD/DEAH box helicase [Anaerolineae bacterium]
MIAGVLEQLAAAPGYAGQMVHIEHLSAREAEYAMVARPWPTELEALLQNRGLTRLYAHQARAIDAIRDGENVMVATGTASGKTLCYNLPVLEAILRTPMSRALYLFPTRALARDQCRALKELVAGSSLDGLRQGVYDGDTPPGTRTRLRRHASVLLSNPDMLHIGILPNHTGWGTFLRHLRFVVLDEAHVYRGIFGSHVALLMRRLWRLAQLYGAAPQFVLCSATLANGREHAERLVGQPVALVDRDGSPSGARQFVLWNPALEDPERGTRHSINADAADILCTLVRNGLRNITFVRARKLAELVALYTRRLLARQEPELVERVAPYRAGYLPAERRAIEQRLVSGDLLAVASTNALELGIDIGALSATVLVGFPGTIASMWQQAGRAGRGEEESLTILLGYSNPLDQYYMQHPSELFGRTPEVALVNPDNPHLLKAHLRCAAFESPLGAGDLSLFGPAASDSLGELAQQGGLHAVDGRWFYPDSSSPAPQISLRSAEGNPYLLIDTSNGDAILEELDAASVFFRAHPGAVYLHQGRSYLIQTLDQERRIALAEPTEAAYYTETIEDGQIEIIRSTRARSDLPVEVYLGQVRVTEHVVGYRQHEHFTQRVQAEHDLQLPPQSFESTALWFGLPAKARNQAVAQGIDLAGGIHAVEHGVIGLLPLLAMCDRNDIGGVSTLCHADTGQAQVFVYDAYPGGVGIAERGFEQVEELWERTLDRLRHCPCAEGCPACIQSPKCGNNNEPLDKAAAIMILRALLGDHSP